MNGLGSPAALVALLTTAVGALMIRLGFDRGVLVRRRERRRCPSCGRLVERRVCEVCTRS